WSRTGVAQPTVYFPQFSCGLLPGKVLLNQGSSPVAAIFEIAFGRAEQFRESRNNPAFGRLNRDGGARRIALRQIALRRDQNRFGICPCLENGHWQSFAKGGKNKRVTTFQPKSFICPKLR